MLLLIQFHLCRVHPQLSEERGAYLKKRLTGAGSENNSVVTLAFRIVDAGLVKVHSAQLAIDGPQLWARSLGAGAGAGINRGFDSVLFLDVLNAEGLKNKNKFGGVSTPFVVATGFTDGKRWVFSISLLSRGAYLARPCSALKLTSFPCSSREYKIMPCGLSLASNNPRALQDGVGKAETLVVEGQHYVDELGMVNP